MLVIVLNSELCGKKWITGIVLRSIWKREVCPSHFVHRQVSAHTHL
jgi:hypothetical protein